MVSLGVDFMASVPEPHMLHLLGDNKMACMFQAGALSALRDMGLLKNVSVLSATGTAQITLGFLLDAIYNKVWRHTGFLENLLDIHPNQSEAAFLYVTDAQRVGLHESFPYIEHNTAVGSGIAWWQDFVAPLYRFCLGNQEWDTVVLYLKNGFWSGVPQWRSFLSKSFSKSWGHVTLGDLSTHERVFLFHARTNDKDGYPLVFANQQLQWYRPDPTHMVHPQHITSQSPSLAQLTSLAGLPTTSDQNKMWASPPSTDTHLLDVRESKQERAIGSSLLTDPFAFAALNSCYRQCSRYKVQQAQGIVPGLTQCAYVIDAWTTVEQQDSVVRRLHQQGLQILQGAEALDQNQWRADRGRVVSALRPHGAETSKHWSPYFNEWVHLMKSNATRMESEDSALLLNAFNYGHLVTWKTYAKPHEQAAYPGLLIDEIGDPYGFLGIYEDRQFEPAPDQAAAVTYTEHGSESDGPDVELASLHVDSRYGPRSALQSDYFTHAYYDPESRGSAGTDTFDRLANALHDPQGRGNDGVDEKYL